MTRALLISSMLLVIATWISTPRANQQAMAGDSNKANVSPKDQDFVRNAASGGMLEVALGRHAAQHAQDQKVRSFGQRMVGDHTRANERLKTIATDLGIEVPAQMEKEHADIVEKLMQLHGKDFDSAYIKHMVHDHQEDVSEFQNEADHGSNRQIAEFAKKTLPTLQEHLKLAEETQKGLSR
jgi:putative membrane protein